MGSSPLNPPLNTSHSSPALSAIGLRREEGWLIICEKVLMTVKGYVDSNCSISSVTQLHILNALHGCLGYIKDYKLTHLRLPTLDQWARCDEQRPK